MTNDDASADAVNALFHGRITTPCLRAVHNHLVIEFLFRYNSGVSIVRKKAWCLYILKCGDDTLYTGITNDLQRRLQRHSCGSASRYTRARLPVTIVYQEVCSGRSGALKKEYAIKRFSRAAKEAYIKKHGKNGR
jgi:putative endonuclease